MTDLARAAKLAKKTTPGPWYAQKKEGFVMARRDGGDAPVAKHGSPDNRAYIAALSPEVIIAAQERMERLEGENADLRMGAPVWNSERELPCGKCGRSNPVWWVDNELWNDVVGTLENPRGEGLILCPTCFVRSALARIARGKVAEWRIELERAEAARDAALADAERLAVLVNAALDAKEEK